MATMQDLEIALANADAAGDTEAATHLAAVIQRAMQDKANLIPGTHIPETLPQAPEPGIGEEVVGAAETAATLATGATTGALGMVGATLKTLAEKILSGEYGTREAAQEVEKAAAEGAARWTYAPRTAAGQEQVGAVGEVLSALPPVLPVVGEVAPAVAATRAAPVAATAKQGVAAAVTAAKEALPVVTTISKERPGVLASVGAAATPEAMRRVTVAEQLPVPMTGEAGLTAGQASRNFAQLQFEKESAKLGDVGAPLRQRVENQTATFIQNFDAMIDKADPIRSEKRDIGMAVTQAVINKANVIKKKINDAYTEAREAGAMKEPVTMEPLATAMADLERFEGVSPMVAAVRREASRIGAILRDERAPGSKIEPGTIPLEGTEQLRQFVNEVTDWTDRRDSLMARKINDAIDAATEGKGGEIYKKARKMRRDYAEEFENVGLTEKLIGTKRGTTERQVAFEDVFDKIVLLSPVEEMNKLRSTLLTAGKDGKQAWADLKAAGIEHIKESSLSPSQKDAAGQPLLSPDKLNKTVKRLDQEGKLDALYGKKQAQTIRDLAELSSVIYTAPPGAINTSNTASAISVAMDGLAGFAVTGYPAPVITSLKTVAKFAKNRKLKARINDALKQVKTEKE